MFSQLLTGKKYSSIPLDPRIEFTMVQSWEQYEKVTKERNSTIYSREEYIQHQRSETLLENHINVIKSKNQHKDSKKSRLQIDEQYLQDIVPLLDEWKCNPFDPETQNFRTLQTGTYASEALVSDFESAHEDGDAFAQDSVNTPLISKSKLLFEPYLKNNWKTFLNFLFSALVATIDLLWKLIRSYLRQYFSTG